ncbi:MAG: D-aminoacylase, partial [candidate division KSB1 bacterium]|nr:D-aminoacylase [candidate division KSB1 bacterium]
DECGDVLIRDGKIVWLGAGEPPLPRTGYDVLYATGMVVCPGFIDVHSHTDVHLLVNPKAESKIRQGVTTEISGNCGYSPFPIGGLTEQEQLKVIKKDFEIQADWRDLDGFFEKLEHSGMALNYATLVGHSTIRGLVLGLENKPATSDDMKRMKWELEKALEQGALGLSTGLEYTPGCFATTEEIIELCKLLPRYQGIYASHIRNEDVQVIEAVEEALNIGRAAEVEVQISHLKACQKRNWLKVDQFLNLIDKARQEGVRVHCDCYPYIAYSTTMKLLFPQWSREGDDQKFVERLQDKQLLPRMRQFVEDKITNLGSWDAVMITRVLSEERRHYQGQTVAQIATTEGTEPFEFVRQLLIQEKGDVSMCGFAMSEENTAKVLAFPLTMVGSDGMALAPYGILSRENPHPRSYGSFPRVLGYYVREKKIMSLAEAIRKMTSLPAEKFGLTGRGKLAVGNFADVVIFDTEKVMDKATFVQPHQYPEGIQYVVVNGNVVIDRGEHTGALPGRILRRG